MIKRVLEIYPGAIIPKNLQKWCYEFDLIMRIDKRTKDDIGKVMQWVYQDSFWGTTIRSPKNLRKNWDSINMQMQRRRQTENEKQEPAAPYHRKIGGA